MIFRGAIAWLAPRHLGACPLLPAMEHYRRLLGTAITQGDFIETLLAEQIILEGLGEAILKRIEEGLILRQAPLRRLRRILLHQEEAHHQFGCRAVDRAMAEGIASPDDLRDRAQQYLALIDRMVFTLGDLFESIKEDPTRYVAEAKHYVPDWLIHSQSSAANDQPSAVSHRTDS